MTETTRVNFHCHSDLSGDGVYSPEALAALLARDGVRYAALTDHDTLDGYERFNDVLRKKGVGAITGVEVTSHWRGNEVHLLAYGFNNNDPDLRHALHVIRKQRRIGLQTVWASLRTTLKGDRDRTDAEDRDEGEQQLLESRQMPPFDAAEIIQRVHAAGGLVFLAHPLDRSDNLSETARIVRELKEEGLDGIEVHYAEYSQRKRESLQALAEEEELLVSGGTDLHGPDAMGNVQAGIDMPTSAWKAFRDALHRASPQTPRENGEETPGHAPALRWKQLATRIGLPALLTIGLFLFTNFVILIPTLEDRLMERKRETARELTATAASLLEEYAEEEQRGTMTREHAQSQALERIRRLRYGRDGKDYFWVTDLQPVMLMHPYRPELDGTDLTSFVDEKGKALFVESVHAVKDDGEGYVDYMWQYKDDPSRVEEKLSHVRLFEPWGWVVGTGIYVEDVREETAALTERLAWIAVAITLLVAALLFFVVQQSLNLERQRSRAQAALQDSHERYRLLVETASEGTLLLVDGKCVFANRAMLDLLDYSPDELRLLDWHDLLPPDATANHPTVQHLSDLMEGRPASLEHAGSLRRKDGSTVPATLVCQRIDMDDRTGLILSARDIEGKEGGAPTSAIEHESVLIEELQSSLLFLNEPLDHFQQTTVTCALDEPIGKVARRMTERNFSAALVVSEAGTPVGIVTDGDLRRRVVAARHDAARPVFEVMSSPLRTIDSHAFVHEALLRMQESNVRHLALRNIEGEITGIVRRDDLLGFHRYASAVVVGEIERAETLEEVVAARERVPQMAASLVDVSARPRSITRLLASVHDATTTRLVRLAMDELGPPPVRFAFLAMGSQGREEETLITDQDNGILYEDVPIGRREEVEKYFLSMGDKVCQWLDAAGYRYCQGGVMARQPEWCASLGVWKERFAKWIGASEPKDIMRVDMCFDFRSVYGAEELTHELRRFVYERIKERPDALVHFANNTLSYKPPLGFFGKIVTKSAGEHEKVFDVKAAMMPIVKFARIYALRERIPQTNTTERLGRMRMLDMLSESGHDEVALAYEYMIGLRLQHQVQMIRNGKHADNLIQLKSLTHIESATLRESLSQIATVQKRISYDFLGGAEA